MNICIKRRRGEKEAEEKKKKTVKTLNCLLIIIVFPSLSGLGCFSSACLVSLNVSVHICLNVYVANIFLYSFFFWFFFYVNSTFTFCVSLSGLAENIIIKNISKKSKKRFRKAEEVEKKNNNNKINQHPVFGNVVVCAAFLEPI